MDKQYYLIYSLRSEITSPDGSIRRTNINFPKYIVVDNEGLQKFKQKYIDELRKNPKNEGCSFNVFLSYYTAPNPDILN